MKAFLLFVFILFFSSFAAAQIIVDITTPVTGTVTRDNGLLGVYTTISDVQVILTEKVSIGPILQAIPVPIPVPVAKPETTYTDTFGRFTLTTAAIGKEYSITVNHASYHQQIRGLTVLDPRLVLRPGLVNVVDFALIRSTSPAKYPVTVTALAGTKPLADVVVTLMPVWEPADICVRCAAPIGIRFYPTDTTDASGEAVFDSISLVPYVDYTVWGTHATSGSQSVQALFSLANLGTTLQFGAAGICLEHNPVTEAGLSCFPNPFNASINFRLTGSEASGLRIYNLRGACVAEFKNARGTVAWNAAAQPSGVYLVKWSGPRGIRTQRILLQK